MNHFNEEDPDMGARIYKEVARLTVQAMIDSKGDGGEVDCLSVGLAAICGAVNATCLIVGQRAGIGAHSSEEEQRSTCNETSALVTALLAVRAGTDNNRFLHMSLNPGIYLSAILTAQQILGREPDSQLNPDMVQAARRWEREVGPSFWGEKISETRRGSLH